MKKVGLFFALFFVGATAAAIENPWIRTCRVANGQFWVVTQGAIELPLCFFDSAGMGAEALFLFKTGTGSTAAVQSYQNRNFSSLSSDHICDSFNAELVQAQDSEGQKFRLCRFSDNSLIEETTLWLGPGAKANASLDQALETVY